MEVRKIINEYELSEGIKALELDKEKPKDLYDYYIENTEFEKVQVYDARKCIAVKSKDNFVGKTVIFT